MPGTNLTRDEAQTRARLLSVDSYTVDLDLTTSEQTFATTTRIAFTCTEPGAETFVDLLNATIHELTLNGAALDPAEVYVDNRILLTGLADRNELVVRADCPYSRTGEGLHRFVDPVDDRVYTYTQFEVPDARRVYATFEQPDLKSVYTFNVTAPADWRVVSNAPTPEPESLDGDRAVWRFPQTEPMSTYITAVIAGDYHAEFATYEGKYGEIALGHYCRQSLVQHMDTDELVKLTKLGFEFFEEAFGYPYPCDGEVAVGHEVGDLGPVDRAGVEPQPDPAAVADVGGHVEAIRPRRDQALVRRRLEHHADDPVAVVVVEVVGERPPPHPEDRVVAAELALGLRQSRADLAQPLEAHESASASTAGSRSPSGSSIAISRASCARPRTSSLR